MQLFKVLIILASTKDIQINYLIKLGTFPSTDELAIEFDDAYEIFLGIIDENNISINQIFLNKLDEINFIFKQMGNISTDNFWNVSSLDFKEWSKIRELAKEALQYKDDIVLSI